MQIFLDTCINYGHVMWCGCERCHICLHSRQVKNHLLIKHKNVNMFVVDREQFSEITSVHEHKQVV